MINILTPDIVPDSITGASDDIRHIIERINDKIREGVARYKNTSQAYGFKNEDGSHDRFRCVIEFEENNSDTTIHEQLVWHAYHKEIMAAYARAGWGVRNWFTHIKHFPENYHYCLFILDEPADEIINKLQDSITKP